MTLILSGTNGLSDVDGSASTPAIRGTDTNTGIFFPAADTIAFAEGGAEVMRIDSAGNVGIGVTPSAWQSAFVAEQVGSSAALWSQKSGFGSTYLSANLYYDGARKFLNTGRTAEYEQFDGNHLFKYSASGSAGATVSQLEAMRIDSSGRLLVGTTSAPGQTGGVVVANNELFVYNIPTTASGANCNISSGESNRFYRSTSALKYKQDIRDIESIDINKFRPVRYKSKCENDDQTKDHFGIIADEVHAAGITELVSYGADGEVEGFQYDRLTVVLVKAIQEQQALIESLTARIAALEAK